MRVRVASVNPIDVDAWIVIRFLMITEIELSWLAGLLEGEGAFCFPPPSGGSFRISLQMCDEDVVARVASMWGTKYYKPVIRNPKHSQSYVTVLKGKKAISMMERLLPHMGTRRSARIKEILESYKPRIPKINSVSAVRILELYAQGVSHGKIAMELGVDRTSVSHFLGSQNKYRKLKTSITPTPSSHKPAPVV